MEATAVNVSFWFFFIKFLKVFQRGTSVSWGCITTLNRVCFLKFCLKGLCFGQLVWENTMSDCSKNKYLALYHSIAPYPINKHIQYVLDVKTITLMGSEHKSQFWHFSQEIQSSFRSSSWKPHSIFTLLPVGNFEKKISSATVWPWLLLSCP